MSFAKYHPRKTYEFLFPFCVLNVGPTGVVAKYTSSQKYNRIRSFGDEGCRRQMSSSNVLVTTFGGFQG